MGEGEGGRGVNRRGAYFVGGAGEYLGTFNHSGPPRMRSARSPPPALAKRWRVRTASNFFRERRAGDGSPEQLRYFDSATFPEQEREPRRHAFVARRSHRARR